MIRALTVTGQRIGVPTRLRGVGGGDYYFLTLMCCVAYKTNLVVLNVK